jgi:CMP-N-acetylneuraminic acid synthetase
MRARSRGLPGKNIRSLAGLPLYAHSVRTALKAGATAVVLSTDIESVLAQAHPSGVLAVARPEALAGDSTTMAEVLIHVLGPEQGLAIDGETTIVLLQPTSPLRAVSDIHAALDSLAQAGVDLAMSVVEVDNGILKAGRLKGGRFVPLSDPAYCFSNRQSLPPVYRPNGAVYAFKAGWFRANKGFETEHIGAVLMPPGRSLDVDSIDDFERAVTLTAQLSEGAA